MGAKNVRSQSAKMSPFVMRSFTALLGFVVFEALIWRWYVVDPEVSQWYLLFALPVFWLALAVALVYNLVALVRGYPKPRNRQEVLLHVLSLYLVIAGVAILMWL